MANKERLIQLRDTVIAEPEKWDQTAWAKRPVNATCGTTMCLAGTAAHLAGESIDWDRAREEEAANGNVVLTATHTRSGRFIEAVASDWLDLTLAEEARLFFAMDKNNALANLDILIAVS